MKRRAFIVAIETYGRADGLAKTLEGTHVNAQAFRNWLIDVHQVSPDDIFMCTEDPAVPGCTAGATRDEIEQELARLESAGKDQTEELFCFLTGHGYCYTDRGGISTTDLLVGADYVDLNSGSKCLKIDEIQGWLRRCMGPDDHYYFIDLCRSLVSEADLRVGPLSLRYDRSNLGDPSVYTLYSTTEGSVAAVGSGFAEALVEGLHGEGRAKVWNGSNMAVLFESLLRFVESKVPNVDKRTQGKREGVIVEIAPPPRYTCRIEVLEAGADDRFSLKVTDTHGHEVCSQTFNGGHVSFEEVPDDYTIEITPNVVAVDPIPVSLYDDAEVRFVKQAAPAVAPPSSTSEVTVKSPHGTHVRIRDAGNVVGELRLDLDRVSLTSDRYDIDLIDDRLVAVANRRINLVAGRRRYVDLTEIRRSELRQQLLGRTGNRHGWHVHAVERDRPDVGPGSRPVAGTDWR